MQTRLIFSGEEADRQLAEVLAEKLKRRRIQIVVDIDQHWADANLGKIVVAVLLTPAAAASAKVLGALRAALESGLAIFVLRMGDVQANAELDRIVGQAMRINADSAGDDKNLSRFANAIASAMIQPRSGTRHQSLEITGFTDADVANRIVGAPGALAATWKDMDARQENSRWSWEAAVLGPLWTVYRAVPVAGFLSLAFLVLAVAIAATLHTSPRAPLFGLLIGWLVLALALGLYGQGLLRNQVYRQASGGRAADRWFRPLGSLGIATVAGFTCFLVINGVTALRDAEERAVAEAAVAQARAQISATPGKSANPLLIGDSGTSRGAQAIRWRAQAEILNLLFGRPEVVESVGVRDTDSDAVAADAAAAAADAAAAAADAAVSRPPSKRSVGEPTRSTGEKAGDSEIIEETFDPVAEGSNGKG
jgi:hypothetical protein